MINIIHPNVYKNGNQLSKQFKEGNPFSHIVIDNFLVESFAEELVKNFPDILSMPHSRDYMFGNKHELSSLDKTGISFQKLYQELISSDFQEFICQITGEDLFVDPELFGGGLHQGGNESFLDMHTDFNIHPNHHNWLRRVNVLLYLNKDWQSEYGGDLRLRYGKDGAVTKIAPIFNRCVIMLSDDTTYHGYNPMTLPEGVTRKSIAAYFYRKESIENMPTRKTTNWNPDDASIIKKAIARIYNPAVLLKNRVLGSLTNRNR